MHLVQQKIWLLIFVLISMPSAAQKKRFLKDPHFIINPSTPINLEKELTVFNDGNDDAIYKIAIGADVPNNKKPMRVLYQMESGHVFIILQKIHGVDTINKVFGFYPYPGIPVFLKRNVKSHMKDNSYRQHDVELCKTISKSQFDSALALSVLYSKMKYRLNTFNCYDYAIKIFNAVAGRDTLPIIHVRYPLFFGKGGSPCGFYKYMKQQQESASAWAPYIQFGDLVAPASTKTNERLLGHSN